MNTQVDQITAKQLAVEAANIQEGQAAVDFGFWKVARGLHAGRRIHGSDTNFGKWRKEVCKYSKRTCSRLLAIAQAEIDGTIPEVLKDESQSVLQEYMQLGEDAQVRVVEKKKAGEKLTQRKVRAEKSGGPAPAHRTEPEPRGPKPRETDEPEPRYQQKPTEEEMANYEIPPGYHDWLGYWHMFRPIEGTGDDIAERIRQASTMDKKYGIWVAAGRKMYELDYAILGLTSPPVGTFYDFRTVEIVYKALSSKLHPDKGGITEHFQMVTEAYASIKQVNKYLFKCEEQFSAKHVILEEIRNER